MIGKDNKNVLSNNYPPAIPVSSCEPVPLSLWLLSSAFGTLMRHSLK